MVLSFSLILSPDHNNPQNKIKSSQLQHKEIAIQTSIEELYTPLHINDAILTSTQLDLIWY